MLQGWVHRKNFANRMKKLLMISQFIGFVLSEDLQGKFVSRYCVFIKKVSIKIFNLKFYNISIWNLGFNIHLKDHKEKCHNANLLTFRPKLPDGPRVTVSECSELCIERDDCTFFYLSIEKYCELYKSCNYKIPAKYSGTIYEKRNEGKYTFFRQ